MRFFSRGRDTLRIAPTSPAFTALLGVLAALPPLSIDLSAPTLPILPRALHTTHTLAGLSLSLFMLGFALGQFAAGRLSDVVGRRPVLLSALTCFALSGVACAFAISGSMLAICRAVQGFGAGASAVISFAMVQDLFEGDAARAKRSYVTAIFCAVPILAPALGAELTDRFGWRSVHTVLAIGGALLVFVTLPCIGESRRIAAQDVNRGVLHRSSLMRADTAFIRAALANALSYGAIFAYIAGSPTVIIGRMGYSSEVFAFVFACTAIALMAGAWSSGRIGRRGVSAAALADHALLAAFCATAAVAAVGLSGVRSGAVLVPLLIVVMFTRGIIAPNMQHLAIERQPGRAGLASAVVGISQLVAGAVASAAVAALLPYLGLNAVALPMALLAGLALFVWRCPNQRFARALSLVALGEPVTPWR
jgi:DHA1 family bicyclomycin/chloramphenicol resistance-like MFS transporter